MAVQYFFERGKTYACNNTTNKWYENVRENKPHIYFSGGEWHYVSSGSHMHFAKDLCAERNTAAHKWMIFHNGELNGSNNKIRAELEKLSRLFPRKVDA